MAPKRRRKRATENDVKPSGAEPLHLYVCEKVRDLRRQRGWTLDQFSSLSGVSRSMLSQIERGAASPTLGVAFRIARAFGMTLGDLVETPVAAARVDVIRAADRQYLFRDDADCRIRTLSPLHLEKDVEFYELTLKPGGKLVSSPHFAGTREFLTVETGRVRVISGDESQELGPGDSAHYPADVPHAIENTSAGEATAFLVDIYARQKPR